MKIELVTSCWNYWRCLCWHLSALVTCPPSVAEVSVRVAYTAQDAKTVEVLKLFEAIDVANVAWSWREYPQKRLMRRAIARHDATQESDADWFVFTDVDYLYRGTALDAMAIELRHADPLKLHYTRALLSSPSHDAGDKAIHLVEAPRVIGRDEFEQMKAAMARARLPRPIGGSQIVSRRIADRGYLPGTRYHMPKRKWRRTFEDTAYRRWLKLPRQALRCNQVMRLRHSQRGRFTEGCVN